MLSHRSEGGSLMKRKILMMVLSVLLVVSMVIAPMSATAASKKTVQILKVTVKTIMKCLQTF